MDSKAEDLYEFVERHATDDVNALRLKYAGKKADGHKLPIEFALIQIEARKKARKKIPGFIEKRDFLFPSVLSAEQASNEAVARFHSTLIPAEATLLDLTAGLGIDAMTFATKGIQVTAIELEESKCSILRHNAAVTKTAEKLMVVCSDSIAYLQSTSERYDIIFADPARRGASGKKVHALTDCQPDIYGNLNLITGHTERFIVKCSPLLDITQLKETVKDLKRIYAVCFRGECKEVLIEISTGAELERVTVVDLDWDGIRTQFEYKPSDTSSGRATRYCVKPSPTAYGYIYEPNAGIMKTGAWGELERQYTGLEKSDVSTHLFLSDMLYPDFPGRILKIEEAADKRVLKTLKNSKINVAERNYPMSASEISKRYALVPGGGKYLYAFRYQGRPMMLTATELI